MLHLQLAGNSVYPRATTSTEILAGVEPPHLFPLAFLLELAGLADAFREVSETAIGNLNRGSRIVRPKV
jgi:hypothetical protein